MPSMVSTSSAAPVIDNRCSRSPAVSDGWIGSRMLAKVGPASSSRTIRKVVAPVIWSPARMACCTGAAPRQAGSSEKCRLIHPSAGMSRTRCGSSAPYATTGQQSGAISASRVTKSSSRGRNGLRVSIPSSAPRSATGLAVSFFPRPLGASGRVTTPTTSWPERTRASSEGTATSGVPAKTIRTAAAYRPERKLLEGNRVDANPQRALALAGTTDGRHLLRSPNQRLSSRPRSPHGQSADLRLSSAALRSQIDRTHHLGARRKVYQVAELLQGIWWPFHGHHPHRRGESGLNAFGELARGEARGIHPDEGLQGSCGAIPHRDDRPSFRAAANEGHDIEPTSQRLLCRPQVST